MTHRGLEIYYGANPSISTRLIDDTQALLYHPDSGCEKHINTSGLFIWQRLDGSLSVREITDQLGEVFASIPAGQILGDATGFLEELSAQGFVTRHPERKASSGAAIKYPDAGDAPQTVDISLTGKCNFRCRYCFYADAMQSRQDLPSEQWHFFFAELGRLAVREVCLSGGEVFVRPDLMDLIDQVTANRMRYSLLTNGTLITEKTVAALEKFDRLTRLSSIQVSIDGSCPEIHDRSRGRGSFDRAAAGLRLLKEAGFPVTSRVTVNRFNVDDLENIARLLLDEIGVQSFGTNDAMPLGDGCGNQDEIALRPAQQLKAMRTLSLLEQKYNGRITAMAGPLANQRMYRAMEHARATGEKTTRWSMGYLTGCGCVFSKLAVHHDGMMTPCNLLPKLELGRINTASVKAVWKTHPTLKALRERRRIPMEEVAGCELCEWTPFCTGGCPGLAREMAGDFNRASPHDCYRRFLDNLGLDGGGRILRNCFN